jgi:Rad3-related DNA helicase
MRAKKRLADVHRIGLNEWVIKGNPSLGDQYPSYLVRRNGQGYWCSCYEHRYGDTRRRETCSHVEAAMLWEQERSQGIMPVDLGLPPDKFRRWRENQLETIVKIANSKKRFIIVQAPTGTGKSAIAVGVQGFTKERILYATHTKQLQEQLKADFPFASVLKGRSNYPCLKYPKMFPKITAQECTKSPSRRNCQRCQFGESSLCEIAVDEGYSCPCTMECPYLNARKRLLESRLGIINFPYFLTEANQVGGLSGLAEWFVADEADMVENSLKGFLGIEVSERMIERLGIKPPAKKTVISSWKEWAAETAEMIRQRLERLRASGFLENLREEGELERFMHKLTFFSNIVSDHWIMDQNGSGFLFKPIFTSRYANTFLWRHVKKVLAMSATIEPFQWCRDLGIPHDEVEFIDLPSLFDPKRRTVYWIPAANMTYKTKEKEWVKVVQAMDLILDTFKQYPTLVHSVSYPLTDFVLSRSRHRGRMIRHRSAAEREEALTKFRNSSSAPVLVSPSMERGVSLEYEACRVIIVLKMPYPSLNDKQVSARLYTDRTNGNRWYVIQAIHSLVQSTGRGTRSDDDWSIIFILDEQFRRILLEYRKLIPSWWLSALVIGDLTKLREYASLCLSER